MNESPHANTRTTKTVLQLSQSCVTPIGTAGTLLPFARWGGIRGGEEK
jgi:hypothetical protein